MIARDQPTIFPSDVLVRVSSALDGTMLDRSQGTHSPEAVANRQQFCEELGMNYDEVVYQQIIYSDEQSYDTLMTVGRTLVSSLVPQVAADGLITTEPGVGIMLPVADCVATAIYDPIRRCLAVLHLGRHSSIASLLEKTLTCMVTKGTSLKDVFVYMSPSAQKQSYVMRYFDKVNDPAWQDFYEVRAGGIHLDLSGYNRQVCLAAGIPPKNIEVSAVDTVTSPDYFSHLSGDTTKRFVLVAMIQPHLLH